MKTDFSTQPKGFSPVSLTITFETERELAILDDMMRYDMSIPELMSSGNGKEFGEIQELMGQLVEALQEIRKQI